MKTTWYRCDKAAAGAHMTLLNIKAMFGVAWQGARLAQPSVPVTIITEHFHLKKVPSGGTCIIERTSATTTLMAQTAHGTRRTGLKLHVVMGMPT